MKITNEINKYKDIFWSYFQGCGINKEIFNALWEAIIKDINEQQYIDEVQEIVNTNFFEDPRNQ